MRFSKHGGEYRALSNVSISFYFTIIQHRVHGAILYGIGVIVNRRWFGLRVVGCNEWLGCVGALDMWSRISGCVVRWMKYLGWSLWHRDYWVQRVLRYDGCVGRVGACLSRWLGGWVYGLRMDSQCICRTFWNFGVKILIMFLLISQLVCKTQSCW